MKVKCLEYDMYSAFKSGEQNHPQAVMRRLGLNTYYRAVPESLLDCWFFLYKEYPDVELTPYIKMLELDDEKMPELKG